MNFKQAQKKLAAIANGRFYSIKFELDVFHDGTPQTDCRVMIVDSPHTWSGNGSTWKIAFAKLEDELTPKSVEQIPDVSDGDTDSEKRAKSDAIKRAVFPLDADKDVNNLDAVAKALME